MNRWLLVALLVLPGLAQTREGVLEKTGVTLAIQGEVDNLALRPYRVTEDEYFATLVVLRPDGSVRWESSQVADAGDPMAVGAWNYGVSLPELGGDIDRDKVVELIIPAPVSDVRPVEFKVLRWLEGGFRPAYTRALLLGKDGHLRWTTPKEGNQTWVSHFAGWKGEKIVVDLTSTQGKTGKALVTPEKGGFAISSWLSPLR